MDLCLDFDIWPSVFYGTADEEGFLASIDHCGASIDHYGLPMRLRLTTCLLTLHYNTYHYTALHR
jgi:hypothetical protein